MSFTFGGIRKIKIPYKKNDLAKVENAKKIIESCIKDCLNIHYQNVDKETILYNYFIGNQDIKNKKRDIEANDQDNKVVENHANAQVVFKTDFLFSDKMQFSSKTNEKSDDLTFFDRFLTDSGFYTSFREVKKDMYIYGLGVSYCVPRQDILNNDGTIVNGYDKDSDAPFEFCCVSPLSNFVVYSSYHTEDPLFSVSITNLSSSSKTLYEVMIETTNYAFKYLSDDKFEKFTNAKISPKAFKHIPIIEHTRNKERMGIIELNKTLFDVINLIVSYGADAIVDKANNLIVFKDVEVTRDQVLQMRKGGYVKVSSTGDPNNKPDVFTLEMECANGDVNVYYEQRVTKAYDNAGVPISSGTTSSGGDTGKARLLGNGWEGATTKIKGDIIGMEKSDYEMLKLLLNACRIIPNSKVNELKSSEVAIKYNINPNDNILSKTQSAVNLYSIGWAFDKILSATGLSLDVNNDARKWEEHMEKYGLSRNEKANTRGTNSQINVEGNSTDE